MSRYFSQDLDTDHDGKLDLEELSIWIDPKNFVPGKDFLLYKPKNGKNGCITVCF